MAEIVALRPARAGDAESTWRAYARLRDEVAADAENGLHDPVLICRCADAYRAWCRAAAWECLT